MLNAPTDKLDACNKLVLSYLKDPDKQFPNPHNTTDADWFNGTWNVIDRFWTDPSMTADMAGAEFKKLYDSIY